jgi:hypothetical protein
MKRIRLVLGALAIVVASFAAVSGPVLADELDCRDARGDLIRCDGDLYAPYDNDTRDFDYYYTNYDYDDYFSPYYFYSPYFFYNDFDDDYFYGCEGPVCLID